MDTAAPQSMPPSDGPHRGPPPLPARAQLRKTAQLVPLTPAERTTLGDVERHRRQMRVMAGALLLAVFGLTLSVALTGQAPQPPWDAPQATRIGLLVLVTLFACYATQKEARLTVLTRNLLAEGELATRLRGSVLEFHEQLDATRAMNMALDLREVLDTVLRSALRMLGAGSGSIMLARGDDELTTIAAIGGTSARGRRVRFGQGIAGRVAASRCPLLIHGALTEEERGAVYDHPGSLPGCGMSVPLVHGDRLLGVLNVNAESGRRFHEYELRALTGFAHDAGAAIANAQRFEEQRMLASRAAHQAMHDPLTSLPNRALLLERIRNELGRARGAKHRVAVLFIDIDDFKRVNDAAGHLAGDKVLTTFAARLHSCVRSPDTVARFGGDEFVAVLEVADASEAMAAATRLLADLEPPMAVAGREIRFFVSVGVTVASGRATPESLLRDADAAMHEAKRSGKHRAALFDPGMIAAAAWMLEIEDGIHAALERGELTLHYQPIWEITSGTPVACEALLRWLHPRHGPITAGDCIGVFKQAGLLSQVDMWALRRVCTEGRNTPGKAVHVNVSAETLHDLDIADAVISTCRELDFPLERLVLELTETSLVAAPNRAADQFNRLKSVGVHLMLDDFGVGYSSFSYLQRFPVSGVKIDRGFVAAIDASTERSRLVESIVHFAENLGLDVIAEGVETAEQQRALLGMGCRLGQGYLFGAAAPAIAFPDVPARAGRIVDDRLSDVAGFGPEPVLRPAQARN